MELKTLKYRENYLNIPCRQYTVTLALLEGLVLGFFDSDFVENMYEVHFSKEEALEFTEVLESYLDCELKKAKQSESLPTLRVSRTTWGEPFSEAVRVEFSEDFENYNIEPVSFELSTSNTLVMLDFLKTRLLDQ